MKMQTNNCKYIESYRERVNRLLGMSDKIFRQTYGDEIEIAKRAMKHNRKNRLLLNSPKFALYDGKEK